MQNLIADFAWYAVSAFVCGFVAAWGLCAPPEPIVAAEGERRRRLIDRLWRGYRAYDKGAGWWDRISWLLGLFKTNAGMAVAVASVGTVGTVGAIAIKERVIEPHKMTVQTAAIPEPPAEEIRQTRNSTVFTIEGKDQAGRRGTFDVVVLNKSFLWVRGSAYQLEKDGKTIAGSDLAAAVLDDEVRTALADAAAVIAVGAASQEGSAVEEQARAERRARTAAALVGNAVTANVPVWTLNLGQYREQCTDCETGGTSWQRPFIVIAVKSLEPDTDMGEALADAMSGKERLPSPKNYSAFGLTRFR
jgi:hypothetical protein